MAGGQSSLRTAVVALGMALVMFGAGSLLRGTFAPVHETTSRMGGRLVGGSSGHAPLAIVPVLLGSLETEDDSARTPQRIASAPPAHLMSQIEVDDLPPAPQTTPQTEATSLPDGSDAASSRRAPAAELLDAEPMTSAPDLSSSAKNDSCCERQERQLARIACGMEWLSQHAWLALADRGVAERPPVQIEAVAPPPERPVTALIKIERTAEDRDRFSLEVRHAPLPDVFDVLCELAGLKLELAGEVTGRVSLTIREVTLGEAINRVLQHANLGVERNEHILRVMPRAMAEERTLHRQPLETRQYRLRTMRSAELIPLIRPLLTPRLGRFTVRQDQANHPCPDPKSGAIPEVLVIVDRVSAHDAIGKLLQELDVLAPRPQSAP